VTENNLVFLTNWTTIPFNRNEFACHCGCGMSGVDCELLSILIDLRHMFGRLKVTSGNRCKSHNTKVGGAPESYHIKSMAADCTMLDVEGTPSRVYSYLCLKYPNKYGFILYKSWVHVDVRAGRYREVKQ
jgi:uncharacterized protein YcbK (DUF882 family)